MVKKKGTTVGPQGQVRPTSDHANAVRVAKILVGEAQEEYLANPQPADETGKEAPMSSEEARPQLLEQSDVDRLKQIVRGEYEDELALLHWVPSTPELVFVQVLKQDLEENDPPVTRVVPQSPRQQ